MARVRYEPNEAGLGELLRSDGMLAAMESHAGRIKALAEATSPFHSGDYLSKFRIVSTKRGGPKADRAQATVENYSDHAFYVEYGTSRMKGQHVLFNAVQAAAGGGGA